MTTHWGIDLGVRSFHAAGLRPDGTLELFSHVIKPPKSVAEQHPHGRALELVSMADSLLHLVKSGDQVAIEEPPLAGRQNVRTFLKLAQVSGAIALAASSASVAYVSVDGWKKDVIGRGGTSKEAVAAWLWGAHPALSKQCRDNQNFIDATCIALWCKHTLPELLGARAGSVPHPLAAVASG